MAQIPPQPPMAPIPPAGYPVKPHRGVLILILGLVGFFCCAICGVIAWVLGNTDLKEMAAGQMDRSGEGLTQAGKIIGIISVVVWILVFVGQFFFFAFLTAAGSAVSHRPY